jgi:hypothetical protein
MVQVEEVQDIGLDVLIAGLGFQVLSLVLFAVACIDFAFLVYRGKGPSNPSFTELRSSRRWAGFLFGESLISMVSAFCFADDTFTLLTCCLLRGRLLIL